MESEWSEILFGNATRFVSEKLQAKDASINSYISTENMLGNFGGVTTASTLPLNGGVTHFKVGDTLFSNIRTYFKKVWQAKFDGCCSNDVLVFRSANVERLLPDYLYQISRWEKFTEHSISTSKGAKMPRGDKDALANFKFLLPSIEEQRAITRILRTLDDKIDHNRALAANLEAIARHLFKSWFVDFDPVRAKAAGEKPAGLADDIAALFPDRFVESEIGEVPEGWTCCPLPQIAAVHSGGTPKRAIAEYWGGSIPWFSVVDTPSPGQVFVIETSEHITEAGLANSAAKVLPNGSTIISARGTVGKLALTCAPITMNQSCYALKGTLGDFFTYFTVTASIDWLKQNVHGAVFDTITRATLDGLLVIRPSDHVAVAFDKTVRPLMQRIETCGREALVLTKLRDILLPRLISGKLRVEDAETMIEEAVA